MKRVREPRNSWWSCAALTLSLAVLGLVACVAGRSPVVAGENDSQATLAQANPAKPPAKPVGEAKPRRPLPQPLTPEQEQQVFAFVKEHHRELERLLSHLRQHRPQEYGRAVREMSRNVERIEAYRARDLGRYELEVKLWQLQSRSQLLAARITMADESQLREELRQLLGQQTELRIQLLQHEKAKIMERSAKLDEQIARLEQNRDANLERQLNTLLQGAKPSDKKK